MFNYFLKKIREKSLRDTGEDLGDFFFVEKVIFSTFSKGKECIFSGSFFISCQEGQEEEIKEKGKKKGKKERERKKRRERKSKRKREKRKGKEIKEREREGKTSLEKLVSGKLVFQLLGAFKRL